MIDYQQKLVEIMRKENETRQVLADALRDSEAALAIAAAENRIEKYSDLTGFLRYIMGDIHLTVEQKVAEVAKARIAFTAVWESQFTQTMLDNAIRKERLALEKLSSALRKVEDKLELEGIRNRTEQYNKLYQQLLAAAKDPYKDRIPLPARIRREINDIYNHDNKE